MLSVVSRTNLVLKNVLLIHAFIGSVKLPIRLMIIEKFEPDMNEAMVFITSIMKPNVKKICTP